VRRLRALVPRPVRALDRLRMLALAYGEFTIGLLIVNIIVAEPGPTAASLRPGAVVALLWLAGWWLHGYRRGRRPAVGVPAEFATVVLSTVAGRDPTSAFTLVVAGMVYRPMPDWRWRWPRTSTVPATRRRVRPMRCSTTCRRRGSASHWPMTQGTA
jgi:hypothetical protein